MYTILFRTFFLYILITLVIRGMGKRQVGEIEMSELVTTLLLSQIVSLPIEDPAIPLAHVVLPVLLIVCTEILITFLKGRFNFLKRVFENKPTVLIDKGTINQRELLRVRITLSELLGEVRRQGFRDIGEIYYAFLEENGQFSLLPRADASPLTPKDMGKTPKETGYAMAVIEDGVIQEENLKLVNKDRKWLAKACQRRGVTEEEIFLMTVDESDSISLVRKEERE